MSTSPNSRLIKKDVPFTMVANDLINKDSLSWQAKGVLIYLLSKPQDWKVYKADIVKHSKNGKSSVDSAIKELKEQGYLALAKVINTKGQIVEWRYYIYTEPIDSPILKHYEILLDINGHETTCLPESENKNMESDKPESGNQFVDTDSPESENQVVDSGKPEPDFPTLENPPQENHPTSNTKYNNTESNNTQSNQEKRLSKKDYIMAIKKQIDFATWEKSAQKQDAKDLNVIIGYMADLCYSNREQIKINKQMHNTDHVRDQFLNSISLDILLKVLDIYKSQGIVSKPRPYIWTCVYNEICESSELDQPAVNEAIDAYNANTPSYDLDELSRRGMYVPEL